MPLIYAPWTDEQVAALYQWQACDNVHPFTCGGKDSKEHAEFERMYGYRHEGVLIPAKDGWHCPVCDYTQNWAHDFMLNPPGNILVDCDRQDRKKPK